MGENIESGEVAWRAVSEAAGSRPETSHDTP